MAGAYHKYQLLVAAVAQFVELSVEEDDEAVELELELLAETEAELAVVATQLPRHEPMLHGNVARPPIVPHLLLLLLLFLFTTFAPFPCANNFTLLLLLFFQLRGLIDS